MAQTDVVPPVTPLASPAAVRWPRALLLVVTLAIALGIGFGIGGEGGRFATTGSVYAPLILLAILLQFRDRTAARVLSWLWFWCIVLATAVFAVGITALQLAPSAGTPTAAQGRLLLGPVLAVLLIVLVAMLVAATPAWAALGRWLGGRPDRRQPAHVQGTVGVLVVSALGSTPLVFLNGHAPVVDLVNRMEAGALSLGFVEQLLSQMYTVFWTVILVLVGAAWPARTSIRGAMARLGLGRLSKRDVLPLAAVTLFAVGLGLGLDVFSRSVLASLDLPVTDASVIARLIPAATTPLGAITVAVCAGVSEELLFRGLLQPRLGWLLANLGFAAAHAFQYGLDGLVVVFALGAIQAFVRQRWNTSAAIGVHASYDAVTLLLNSLGF
jgi:membrane protease YdiL (CAAX protease family)